MELGLSGCGENQFGIPELRWPASLAPENHTTQDAQKGQTSHPPSPGGYFTRPPRVCQDSLFAQGRALPQARPQRAIITIFPVAGLESPKLRASNEGLLSPRV